MYQGCSHWHKVSLVFGIAIGFLFGNSEKKEKRFNFAGKSSLN